MRIAEVEADIELYEPDVRLRDFQVRFEYIKYYIIYGAWCALVYIRSRNRRQFEGRLLVGANGESVGRNRCMPG